MNNKIEKDGSLGIYLKEVSKEPLISHEKEIELSRRIKEGDEKALDELVKANLRFVIFVAKQYQNKGIPLEDLISEGNLGLIHSAKLFNGELGIHFISYAIWWIRRYINDAINSQNSDVRLPTSQTEPKTKILKAITKFEQKNGRVPEIEELMELTGFDEDFINRIMLSTNKCISMDTPMSIEDESYTLADCIPDVITDSPETKLNNDIITEEILNIVGELNNREHDIICMAFGLNGCVEMSYRDIARKFALSAERIGQIVQAVLKRFKVKYPNLLKKLYNG